MLCLQFKIDRNVYGFEYDKIVEVVPWVPLTPIAGAPEYVPGYFNYRGTIVPVIDLTRLTAGRDSEKLLSSRIAVVDYRDTHLLGLLLENASTVVELKTPPENRQESGIATDREYLGEIAVEENAAIQLVNTEKVLSEEVRRLLFVPKESGHD